MIDVNDATTQTRIALRQPLNNDPAIGAPNFFYDITLPFTVDATTAGHQFEFRIWWDDTSSISEGQLGYVPLQWNGANTQANPWHLVGRPVGTEWQAQVGDGQQWFQYGPYTTLTTGTYIAMWTLRIDIPNAYNNAIAYIDVNDATTQTVMPIGPPSLGGKASRVIMRHDFLAPQTQQVFYIMFTVPPERSGHQFEFRVWYENNALLSEEAIGVVKVQ